MSSPISITDHAAPLRLRVVDALRSGITEGRYRPGERLTETVLCASYGVSRSVVREALRQLESEQLITLLPYRGPIVTLLQEHEIDSLYEVRLALEGLVGELFARRASDDGAAELIAHYESMHATYLHGDVSSRGIAKDRFYRLLLEGTGNLVLAENLRAIHSRIGIFRHAAYRNEERVALSWMNIGRIVQAAAHDRDPDHARQMCQEHIAGACELAKVEYRNWV